MNIIILNKDLIVVRKRIMSDTGSIPTDIIETYGTEYGIFIPISTSGFQFLRWLKRGAVENLPKNVDILSFFVHIANDGEICIVVIDSNADFISVVPYYNNTFSVASANRDTAEALSYLIRNSKTVGEAITVVDAGNMEGMHDPHIFFASDWVAYAKEKGYVKSFYYTNFTAMSK